MLAWRRRKRDALQLCKLLRKLLLILSHLRLHLRLCLGEVRELRERHLHLRERLLCLRLRLSLSLLCLLLGELREILHARREAGAGQELHAQLKPRKSCEQNEA